MSVTHVPAQSAVTKIVEVSPATPEKYVLELTLHQALCLAALSGTTTDLHDDGGLWGAMRHHPLYRTYRDALGKAKDEGLSPFFKDLTGSEVQHDVASIDRIRVRRVVEGVDWTVGKVYTVDMGRNLSYGRPGVVADDAGDERIYFPGDFEPI